MELGLSRSVNVIKRRLADIDVDGGLSLMECVDVNASNFIVNVDSRAVAWFAFATTYVDATFSKVKYGIAWLSLADVYVYSAFAKVNVGASELSFCNVHMDTTLPHGHRRAFVFPLICMFEICILCQNLMGDEDAIEETKRGRARGREERDGKGETVRVRES